MIIGNLCLWYMVVQHRFVVSKKKIKGKKSTLHSQLSTKKQRLNFKHFFIAAGCSPVALGLTY